MAIDQEGKDFAPKGNEPMTADYGQRAAMALDSLVTGPHRDKAIARLFGVSVRMAKYLRSGQHWTLDRLNQASQTLGEVFDVALHAPADAQRYTQMSEINERLASLEARFAQMDRGATVGLAQEQGGSADRGSLQADRSLAVAGAVRGSAPSDGEG